MKICVAQTRPATGNIQRNIDNHKELINLASLNEAGLIIFPELSLTGYEPKLAKELATTKDDSRLNVFQSISNSNNITIGVGIPAKSNGGVCISMVLLKPYKPKQIYSKKYLHSDEDAFFVPGENITGIGVGKLNIALAICYELSIKEHAENAFANGAELYIASVAKTLNGVDKASQRLSEIAADFSMTVLMSNCVGDCDGDECAGKSSVWNNKGVLLAQLNNTDEGILIFDTATENLIEKTI